MPSGFTARARWGVGLIGWTLFLYAKTNYAGEGVNYHLQSTAIYQNTGAPSYTAALYLSEPREYLTAQTALKYVNRMGFKMLRPRMSSRSWGRDLIQKAVINNTPADIAAREPSFKAFSAVLIEWLYEGDVLEFRRHPNGLSFYVNDVELAFFNDPDLFSTFLRVWIGDVPPSSEFKTTLLSHSVHEGEARDFSTRRSSGARVARAKTWLTLLHPAPEVLVSESETDISADIVLGQAASDPRSDAQNKLVLERQRLAEKEAALNALQEKMDTEHQKRQAQEKVKEEEKAQEQVLAAYTRLLYRHPNDYIRYPVRSQARREQGLVEVMVQINRQGEVLDAQLSASSDYMRLDKAALNAVRNASPFPDVPATISGKVFEFVIPLNFRLQ